jgi:disulfide bond formation protein DsbB
VTASDTFSPTSAGRGAGPCAWAALVAAVVVSAGSLYLSLGLGLRACPLCFYQRTFALSLAAVLGVGLLAGYGRGGSPGLAALPLAVAGLGVAMFHVGLELTGKLECPGGVLGLGTAPQQSLVAFLILTALLAFETWEVRLIPARAGAVAAGTLLAVASCVANPPMPAPPAVPYEKPPDICRPPFRTSPGT